ncbi:MAG: hypothetical protein R3E84_21675 [Pseudomonadales bacterium]
MQCRNASASLLFNACMHEAQDDLLKSAAECLNEDDDPECRTESHVAFREATGNCQTVKVGAQPLAVCLR